MDMSDESGLEERVGRKLKTVLEENMELERVVGIARERTLGWADVEVRKKLWGWGPETTSVVKKRERDQ